MTTREAGEFLGVSDSRVRQLIRDKVLPTEKVGHINTIKVRDLERLAKQFVKEAPGRRGRKRHVVKAREPKPTTEEPTE